MYVHCTDNYNIFVTSLLMKKKPTKETWVIDFLNMGCYPGTVLFSYQLSFDELIATMKKNYKIKFWKSDNGATHWLSGIEGEKELIDNGSYFALYRNIYNTITGEEKNLYYIILKNKFEFTDWDYCMLAHECLHIVQYFLPDILDRNKEHEAEAYLHTHLMQQCLKIIRTTCSK